MLKSGFHMEKNLKTNKKAISTMLIAAIVVVIIVVVGVGAYYAFSQMSPAPSESPSPTATATPSASVQPTPSGTELETASPSATSTLPSETTQPTATASPSAAPNVAGATSLKYSVSLTENGVLQGAYTYWGKNAGTNSFMMRIEYTDSDSSNNAVYIFNGAQQKAWTFSNNEWTDISAAYSTQVGIWSNLWNGYVNNLALGWTGAGDYSYTSAGSTVRIYDISVNPALEDSLFVHT
jgi:cytoskeletal protein RodZ